MPLPVADAASPSSGTRSSFRTSGPPQPLTRLIDLPGHRGRIKGVVWNAPESSEDGEDVAAAAASSATRLLASMDTECVRIWELNATCTALASPSNSPIATLSTPAMLESGGPNAACWDPHHAGLLCSADGVALRTWDVRAEGSNPALSIEGAHEDLILDVDYNPNKPYHLLSGGRDRRVHLWDLRSPRAPLRTLLHHSHWTWCCRFNRFHDQLVLTAGTELVNLWNMVSVSSAPIGELEGTAVAAAAQGLSTPSVTRRTWAKTCAHCFCTV